MKMNDQFKRETICRVPVELIEKNTGQIEGLPENPRSWSQEDLEKIAKSLAETPELLDARPLLLYPHGEKFVVLGGNFRLEGILHNGWTDAPAWIYPEDTPVEKLKEIVIKDNGSFGQWDFKKLNEDWGGLPLGEWGIPDWKCISDQEADKDANVKDDDFNPDTDSVETVVNEGDVYKLGDHRLMCGDSTDADDVNTLRGGGVSRFVFNGSAIQCECRKC